MAQQTIRGGQTSAVVTQELNDMFTELYDKSTELYDKSDENAEDIATNTENIQQINDSLGRYNKNYFNQQLWSGTAVPPNNFTVTNIRFYHLFALEIQFGEYYRNAKTIIIAAKRPTSGVGYDFVIEGSISVMPIGFTPPPVWHAFCLITGNNNDSITVRYVYGSDSIDNFVVADNRDNAILTRITGIL